MKRSNSEQTVSSGEAFGQAALIEIENIKVPERWRSTNEKAIEALRVSMEALGLLTPIMIRFAEAEESAEVVPILVAGARRLEAAKRLGWTSIYCLTLQEGDAVAAEMREIAENLHRRALTKKQRDDHIRRYAELLQARIRQSGQIGPNESRRKDGKGHRQKGVAATIADDTGLSKKTIERALNPPSPRSAKAPRKSSADASRDRLKQAWLKAKQSEQDWFLDWVREQKEGGATEPSAIFDDRAGKHANADFAEEMVG